MTPVKILQSRSKAVAYLIPAASLAALGGWSAFTFDNNFAIGMGGASALFFGYHSLYFLMVLIKPSEMILSADGLRIEHGRGGPAWGWETVARAKLVGRFFKEGQLELTDGKTPGIHSVWTLSPPQLVNEINRWRNRYGDLSLPPAEVTAEEPERKAEQIVS